MDSGEFNREMTRLCDGFRQELTRERRDALLMALRPWPPGLLSMAVDRLLGGKYFPDIDRMERVADEIRPRFDARNPSLARRERVVSEAGDHLVVQQRPEFIGEGRHETEVQVTRVDPRRYCRSEGARDFYIRHWRLVLAPNLEPETGEPSMAGTHDAAQSAIEAAGCNSMDKPISYHSGEQKTGL